MTLPWRPREELHLLQPSSSLPPTTRQLKNIYIYIVCHWRLLRLFRRSTLLLRGVFCWSALACRPIQISSLLYKLVAPTNPFISIQSLLPHFLIHLFIYSFPISPLSCYLGFSIVIWTMTTLVGESLAQVYVTRKIYKEKLKRMEAQSPQKQKRAVDSDHKVSSGCFFWTHNKKVRPSGNGAPTSD